MDITHKAPFGAEHKGMKFMCCILIKCLVSHVERDIFKIAEYEINQHRYYPIEIADKANCLTRRISVSRFFMHPFIFVSLSHCYGRYHS